MIGRMLTDDVRRRLEGLNRAELPLSARIRAQQPGRPGQGTGQVVLHQSLDQAIRGAEQLALSGPHYRVCRPIVDFWRQGAAQLVACQRDWPGPIALDRLEHPELEALVRHFFGGAVFLDLETCGFAGSMVFLIGLIWCDGQTMVLDQLLARDYSEEAAILETLSAILTQQSLLVTFNGKSFDGPMLVDRLARHRLPELPWGELVHCDLLHHARRRWKSLLPDCRLQTLERFVCRRHRRLDIPGAEIPAVYHDFVRTGDAARLARAVEHNALDLLTLVQVGLRIVGAL